MSSILNLLESRFAKGEKTITIQEIASLLGQYSEKYDRLNSICNRIYIARNISLNEKEVLTCLEEIDRLMADRENKN